MGVLGATFGEVVWKDEWYRPGCVGGMCMGFVTIGGEVVRYCRKFIVGYAEGRWNVAEDCFMLFP